MMGLALLALALMAVAAEKLGTAHIDSGSLFLGFCVLFSSALICAQIHISTKGK